MQSEVCTALQKEKEKRKKNQTNKKKNPTPLSHPKQTKNPNQNQMKKSPKPDQSKTNEKTLWKYLYSCVRNHSLEIFLSSSISVNSYHTACTRTGMWLFRIEENCSQSLSASFEFPELYQSIPQPITTLFLKARPPALLKKMWRHIWWAEERCLWGPR